MGQWMLLNVKNDDPSFPTKDSGLNAQTHIVFVYFIFITNKNMLGKGIYLGYINCLSGWVVSGVFGEIGGGGGFFIVYCQKSPLRTRIWGIFKYSLPHLLLIGMGEAPIWLCWTVIL